MTRPTARRRRQSRMFAGVLGGLAALAVGIVVVRHVRRGGEPGLASPREVVTAMLDRARAGDPDGVIALSGGRALIDRVLDCRNGAMRTRVEHDVLHDQDDTRARALAWKGLDVTVDAIDTSAAPVAILTPGTDRPDCRVETQLDGQDLRVRLHVVRDGARIDDAFTVRALRADGRWYLDRLPHVPDDDHATMARMRDEMCACHDPDCTDRVTASYHEWTAGLDGKYGAGTPDEAMMEVSEQMAKCMSDAMARPALVPPATP